jgi:hypothetical protein
MFSKILRRTHMYLALFLAPWVLMYTLSTMAMNHRDFFGKMYGGAPPVFEKEREITYSGTLPAGAAPKAIAPQLLQALDLDGAHGARADKAGVITINRFDALTPRRITYHPDTRQLTVERQVFRTPAFLERMHRRRGFQAGYHVNTAWWGSVDLFVLGMVFWALSGLWLWWELRVTRWLGAISLVLGLALFLFYVFAI